MGEFWLYLCIRCVVLMAIHLRSLHHVGITALVELHFEQFIMCLGSHSLLLT